MEGGKMIARYTANTIIADSWGCGLMGILEEALTSLTLSELLNPSHLLVLS